MALHEENEAFHEEWVSLHEAAKRLGISPRAVQMRAQSGKLTREKRDGKVLFAVTVREALHEESELLHEAGEAVHEVQVQDTKHLHEEITWLRGQVETHNQAESELRRLLLSRDMEIARMQQEMKLLAAPVETPTEPPLTQDGQMPGQPEDEAHREPQGPKRGFWKRLLRGGA